MARLDAAHVKYRTAGKLRGVITEPGNTVESHSVLSKLLIMKWHLFKKLFGFFGSSGSYSASKW